MRATLLIAAALLASCNYEAWLGRNPRAAVFDAAAFDAAAFDADSTVDAPTVRLAQQAYIKAPNACTWCLFGFGIALSADGSTLAVGAHGENSAATGIDGDHTSTSAAKAGAVYVFTYSSTIWSQQAYVKASNTDPTDEFGFSVALSADGSTLAVGAPEEASAAIGIDGNQADNSFPEAGAVYVFTRTGTTWSQQAYLKASNTAGGDYFSKALALSADGSTLAVSAFREDSAARGIDGDQADNSAPEAGAVYVFTRTGTTWSQQAYIKASNAGQGDAFGESLALSSDGSTLAVGAIEEDSAATGVDGDQFDNSAANTGAVYVFTRSGTAWSQQAYIKAPHIIAGRRFGRSLALSGDGSTLAVGGIAPLNMAYVFKLHVTWSQQAQLEGTYSNIDEGDHFGRSVALSSDGSILAVGAPGEDSAASGVGGNQADNSLWASGAAYLFTLGGMVWSEQAYIKASNPGQGHRFGFDLALSADGSTLAVGADGESSATTGINGVPSGYAGNAGAVYVLR